MIPADLHNLSTAIRRSEGSRRLLYGSFALAAIWIVIVAGLVNRTFATVGENAARANRTMEVLDSLRTLVADVAETRRLAAAYALTGATASIDEIPREANHALNELRHLRTLLESKPPQQPRLEALATAIAQDMSEVQSLVQARHDGELEAARATAALDEKAASRTQGVADAIAAAERGAAAGEEALAVNRLEIADLVVGIGGLVAIGSLLVALVAIRRDWTGRILVDEALRRSEGDLSVTLDSIADAVLTTDAEGKIRRMNEAAEQMTGWREAEALGRPVGDVFCTLDEKSRESVLLPVSNVLATGETYVPTGSVQLVARDGTERSITESAAPIHGRPGKITGVVVAFRDVSVTRAADTKIMAAHRALAAEKARLEFLFSAAPVGLSYVWTEADGRKSRLINEAHLQLCGLTRAEAEDPENFIRVTHPDDRAERARVVAQMEAGVIDRFTLDKRYLRPDGRVVWVIHTAERRRHRDGSYEDLSVAVDITKRKKAEAELERFFNVALDFLTIAGADGYFKRVNPTVTDILGWSVEEFLAQPYMTLVHPDDRAATQVEVDRQLGAGEKVLHFENRYRHKDGSWRVLAWRSVPQPDGLMYGAARDVTQTKIAEAEIQRLNESLRNRAAQADAVNKELEAFSYSVSHDLRAPLRRVDGFCQMFMDEFGAGLTPDGRRILENVSAGTTHMSELIDALLRFARYSRQPLQTRPVQTEVLVRRIVGNFNEQLQGRSVELQIGALPDCVADGALLEQVFTNFISNALKFTSGRTETRIEVGSRQEDGEQVYFVKDNGVGFDMRYADRLFGVFQRLHKQSEFEGTGIGLSIVHRIVRRHGGRTWAESRPQEGATFYFSLPLQAKAAVA